MKKIDLPSLAAIREGKGGQHIKQQRSRNESVFIVQASRMNFQNGTTLICRR